MIKFKKGNITEFDMVAASISILAEEGFISDAVYTDLRESDKHERLVAIGKAIKEHNLAPFIESQIKFYVNKFIEENKINEEYVLEIAKDAVFVLNISPERFKMGEYVEFMRKNSYYSLLEISITPSSNKTIKIYKNSIGIRCRGGKINTEHTAYSMLDQMLSDIFNKGRTSIKLVKDTMKVLKDNLSDRLIEQVDNEYLASSIKDIIYNIS